MTALSEHPSGLALLKDNTVKTSLVYTVREIIENIARRARVAVLKFVAKVACAASLASLAYLEPNSSSMQKPVGGRSRGSAV